MTHLDETIPRDQMSVLEPNEILEDLVGSAEEWEIDINREIEERGEGAVEESVQAYQEVGFPIVVEDTSWNAIYESASPEERSTLPAISIMTISPPIETTQLVLACSGGMVGPNDLELVVTDSRILIPNILGAEDRFIMTTNDVGKPYKGILYLQRMSSSFSLYSYIPFDFKAKKILAFCRKKQVYHVSLKYATEPTENVLFPGDPRPLSSILTDRDKVFIRSMVNKERAIQSWLTLEDVIMGLWETIGTTIDPNYMRKLFELNMMLSYPQQASS